MTDIHSAVSPEAHRAREAIRLYGRANRRAGAAAETDCCRRFEGERSRPAASDAAGLGSFTEPRAHAASKVSSEKETPRASGRRGFWRERLRAGFSPASVPPGPRLGDPNPPGRLPASRSSRLPC